MRHLAANALTVLIVLALVVAGIVAWGVQTWQAEGPSRQEVEVRIPRGADLDQVARILDEAGLIKDERIFRIGARYEKMAGRIQAGEFAVPPGASMQSVLQCLVDQSTCRRVMHRITVVEGSTVWQVVEQLKAVPELTGEITEIPGEGWIAPETYQVDRGDTRQEVLDRMVRAQEEILDAAWESRAPDLPLKTKEEALILASIVEKETGVPDERAQVAAVFINRLNRGMRLQTDPTVIYGITEGKGPLGRGIRRSELDRATPWNTYQIDGLPKTPIANPGRAAIEATLHPAETNDIYFVADGTGGHVFSSTLAEHNRNVAKWRRIEAERAAD